MAELPPHAAGRQVVVLAGDCPVVFGKITKSHETVLKDTLFILKRIDGGN